MPPLPRGEGSGGPTTKLWRSIRTVTGNEIQEDPVGRWTSPAGGEAAAGAASPRSGSRTGGQNTDAGDVAVEKSRQSNSATAVGRGVAVV